MPLDATLAFARVKRGREAGIRILPVTSDVITMLLHLLLSLSQSWQSALVLSFIQYPTATVYKCHLLFLVLLWQMPMWHRMTYATAIPSGIFPCESKLH